MKIIASILIFFSAISSLAINPGLESILVGKNQKNEKIFVIRYYAEGQWAVRQVVQHADGWQDLISEKYYKTLVEAQKVQANVSMSYNHDQPMAEFEFQSSPEIQLSGQGLWPTVQAWDQNWEEKYAEWVEKDMNTQFLAKYNVATDCADVAYAARWIFARINGLPAANHLSGTVLFTNQSLRPEWQSLPTAKNWFEDKRFLAALNYLLDLTYTHTLMRDSYPVEIAPGRFLAGTHYLNLHEASGHTQLVHHVSLAKNTLPLMILQSTTPRKVRDLNESLFWANRHPEPGASGFLKILWPVVSGGQYTLKAAASMPGYSLQQYAPDFIRNEDTSFGQEVMLRLQPDLNFLQILKSGLADLKNSLQLRAQIVEDGYQACGHSSCPEGSQGFEDWSTPSRDSQLSALIQQLRNITNLPFKADLKKEIEDFFKTEQGQIYLNLKGNQYSLKQILFTWDAAFYSSDPRQDVATRWGLDALVIAQKIKNDVKAAYENRHRKIELATDQLLRKNNALARFYCEMADASSCRIFQDQMELPLQILNETKNLQEWLSQAFWLNSDPKQSQANQWGALQSKALFQDLAGLREIQVSKDGIGWIKDRLDIVRMGPINHRGLQEVVLPAGFKWQLFDRKKSMGYATFDQQLLRFDFIKQKMDLFPTTLKKITNLLLAGSDDLILIDGETILKASLGSGSLQNVWQESFKKIIPFQKDLVFMVEGPSGWHYLDLKGSQPVMTPILEPGFDGTVPRNLVFENSKVFIFVTDINPESYLIVQKGTGQVSVFNAPGGVVSWSDQLSLAVVNVPPAGALGLSRGGYLLNLSSDFKILHSQKIGDYVTATGPRIIFYSYDYNGKARQAHFQGESLQDELLLKDEERFSSSSGDHWVMTLLKNQNTRIRNLEGTQTYYEGPSLNPLGAPLLPEWGFTVSEDGLIVRSFKNPEGPAALIFDLNLFLWTRQSVAGVQTAINRGFVFSGNGVNFWLDLKP